LTFTSTTVTATAISTAAASSPSIATTAAGAVFLLLPLLAVVTVLVATIAGGEVIASSPAIAVDSHSEDGIVLCQINASHYNIHETSLYLAVTLHAPVQDVMRKLAGTGWVPGAWAIVGLIFRGMVSDSHVSSGAIWCLLCLCEAWERPGIAGLPFP